MNSNTEKVQESTLIYNIKQNCRNLIIGLYILKVAQKNIIF